MESILKNFIASEVSSGKYGSASEVIRTALRMLESEEEKKSSKVKSHLIFYKYSSSEIEITRILDVDMDIPNRLND